MKNLLARLALVLAAVSPVAAAQPAPRVEIDAGRIAGYVTPIYDATGPIVNVGRFSAGLAAAKESDFVAAIGKMKDEWDKLTFVELYVASVRLYDRGFRNEAVYWFYTAQYRGRQFGALLDPARRAGIGHPNFELLQAHNAFHQLVGPYINGYAFRDLDAHAKVVKRVQQEAARIPELATLYPGAVFKPQAEWKAANTELAAGMDKLLASMRDQKDEIKRQRTASGTEARFGKLTSKDLPKR
jgi:hypothetical protein